MFRDQAFEQVLRGGWLRLQQRVKQVINLPGVYLHLAWLCWKLCLTERIGPPAYLTPACKGNVTCESYVWPMKIDERRAALITR